ncbi:MAG: hypothetical protein RL385_2478 [Pseudomonadota bacterium]|jgi:hypothetical protein
MPRAGRAERPHTLALPGALRRKRGRIRERDVIVSIAEEQPLVDRFGLLGGSVEKVARRAARYRDAEPRELVLKPVDEGGTRALLHDGMRHQARVVGGLLERTRRRRGRHTLAAAFADQHLARPPAPSEASRDVALQRNALAVIRIAQKAFKQDQGGARGHAELHRGGTTQGLAEIPSDADQNA